MKYIDGVKFLRKEFPTKDRAQFVPAVKRAYSLINELAQQNDFLNWKVGTDIFPYLRNAAVEFEFKRLIDNGLLDLRYRIAMNSRRNCHHIEIVADTCILTISQVQAKTSVPRKAIYRSNLSFSNQLTLFTTPDFSPDNFNEDKYYAILTHGCRDTQNSRMPEFISLGLPYPDVKRWAQVIDLTAEPHAIDTPEEVVVSDDLVLEFKEHIEKQGVSIK